MNDEIKEILDRIETASEIFDCLLKPEECTTLLNYITNLQEQLHQASLDIQELTERDIECPSWCDKLTNLQQENERLKEEKDNLYLDNTMLKLEKDIYKQGYEDFKNLLNILQNGSEENE